MSVRHALLALLSEGPKYGLQLRQEFEACTGEVWPLNVGQVYTTMQRLERDGLVESDDESSGPQKSYRITDDGAAALSEWLTTPPIDDAPPRDELVIKVLVALRLPDVDVRDMLQTHRRQLIEAMHRYTRLKEHAGEQDDVGVLLVADAEIFRLEAFVRWLDAADARLRNHPGVPASKAPAAPARARRKAAR